MRHLESFVFCCLIAAGGPVLGQPNDTKPASPATLCPDIVAGAVERALEPYSEHQRDLLAPLFEACGVAVQAAKAWKALPQEVEKTDDTVVEASRAVGKDGRIEAPFPTECVDLTPSLFGTLVKVGPLALQCQRLVQGAFSGPAALLVALERLPSAGPGFWLEDVAIRFYLAPKRPSRLHATLVSRSGNPAAVDAALGDLKTLVAGILAMPDWTLARRLLKALFVPEPEYPLSPSRVTAARVVWMLLDLAERAQSISPPPQQEIAPRTRLPGELLPDHPVPRPEPLPLLAALSLEFRTTTDPETRVASTAVEMRVDDATKEFGEALLGLLKATECVSGATLISEFSSVRLTFLVACDGQPPAVDRARRDAIEQYLFAPLNRFVEQQVAGLADPVNLPLDPATAALTSARSDIPPFDQWIVCDTQKGCQVDRSILTQYLGDLGALGREARIIPNYDRDSGTYGGFKLIGIKPNSIYRAIGIRSGDIVSEVNGQEISSPGKALELFEQLKGAPQVIILLMRQGKPYELTIFIVDGLYKQ